MEAAAAEWALGRKEGAAPALSERGVARPERLVAALVPLAGEPP
jgi:hypothetical protein